MVDDLGFKSIVRVFVFDRIKAMRAAGNNFFDLIIFHGFRRYLRSWPGQDTHCLAYGGIAIATLLFAED